MTIDKSEQASEYMVSQSMSCSQAVLNAFCEDYGLDKNLAVQLAQGFAGGMGHTGQTCGAVTGAYMVFGLSQENTTGNAREKAQDVYALIEKFNREFIRLYGSLNCTELTGYDLSIPENIAEAVDKGVFSRICPGYARDAVKIVESLL